MESSERGSTVTFEIAFNSSANFLRISRSISRQCTKSHLAGNIHFSCYFNQSNLTKKRFSLSLSLSLSRHSSTASTGLSVSLSLRSFSTAQTNYDNRVKLRSAGPTCKGSASAMVCRRRHLTLNKFRKPLPKGRSQSEKSDTDRAIKSKKAKQHKEEGEMSI
jgi:hypothetical protein